MIIPADRNSFASYLEGRTAPMRDNFVTKRGQCAKPIRNFWSQYETGSAIAWKYPSVILKADNAHGEFRSVALTDHYRQAATGQAPLEKDIFLRWAMHLI